MPKRQLKLGAFMRPVSIHTGAWRYPGAWPDANFNFAHLKYLIRKLEAGKFDAFFMADHLAVLNMPVNALKRSHTVTSFEPFTLLSALAALTEHIGLIATGSTTFDEPYHVARRFASLDHISGGRAGWNIVTTSNPDAALNFGLEDPWSTPSATSAPASSTTWSPGYGIRLPTTPSCATSRADSISIPKKCMC
jgi:alkanesulfonate monooxygenase